jgi:uncharacterized protein (DUF4415 family)
MQSEPRPALLTIEALQDLPPLTNAQKAELNALKTLPDSDVDYTDAPAMSDVAWQNTERGRFYKPIKQQITARLDADVLAWLKSQGEGYQARINAICDVKCWSQQGRRGPHRNAKSVTSYGRLRW